MKDRSPSHQPTLRRAQLTAVRDALAHGAVSLRILHALTPLFLLVACALAQGGCSSTPSRAPVTAQGPSTCYVRKPAGPTLSRGIAGPMTVPAGTMQGSFSVTSTGEATYSMPLVTVPGRAGVEHYPDEGATAPAEALSFEVYTPSGLVIEYGDSAGGKPLAPSSVPRAWLAT